MESYRDDAFVKIVSSPAEDDRDQSLSGDVLLSGGSFSFVSSRLKLRFVGTMLFKSCQAPPQCVAGPRHVR